MVNKYPLRKRDKKNQKSEQANLNAIKSGIEAHPDQQEIGLNQYPVKVHLELDPKASLKANPKTNRLVKLRPPKAKPL